MPFEGKCHAVAALTHRSSVLRIEAFKVMNDRQNTVVATVVAALILMPLFLIPWRVAPSEEIKWGPIYRPPMSYVRSYDDRQSSRGSTRFEYDEAEVATGVLALQVLAIGVLGSILYVVSADASGAPRSDETEKP